MRHIIALGSGILVLMAMLSATFATVAERSDEILWFVGSGVCAAVAGGVGAILTQYRSSP